MSRQADRFRNAVKVMLVASGVASWGVGSAWADHFYTGPDGGWWYDPANWNWDNSDPPVARLPDPSDTTNLSVEAEGPVVVVFDPANDPNFGAFPADPKTAENPYVLDRLYVSASDSRTAPVTLAIRSGTLSVENDYAIIGRTHQGTVVQTGGTFRTVGGSSRLELGQLNGTAGSGVYDYRGGNLEVSLDQPFSAGSQALRIGSGIGSTGRLIVRNPESGGHIRANHVHVAFSDGSPFVGTTVGIAEFHVSNEGTRPVQSQGNVTLRNDGDQSARLDLVLDEYPELKAGGVPANLGLFDVNFNTADDDLVGGLNIGRIGGASGAPTESRTFWSIDGTTQLTEGSVVRATHYHSTFEWTISYNGLIEWSDADNSVVSGVSGPGTGDDIVLVGLGAVLTGDADRDGDIDAADEAALAAGLTNPSATGWENGDFNGDGVVDADDVSLFDVGRALLVHANGGSVPEPGCLTLVGLVAATMVRRRR